MQTQESKRRREIYETAYDFFAGSVVVGNRRLCPNRYGDVKINLGTAEKFALLGGSGITNVSAHTFIIGDVGSSPTPTVKGIKPAQVKGQLYLKSNPVTAAAQKGLTTAYNQAAGAPCGTSLTGVNLGGKNLIPGVYCFATAAQLTGTLKLDAQGDSNAQWVFQMGTTLTTAPIPR